MMKKSKYKTGLISDFFGGVKSQKCSSSSSPHQTEPQSRVIDEEVTIEEEQVVPSEVTPQSETRANGPNVPANEEFVYDADLLPCDPGKRIPISSYPPNDQDMIRRGFISKGVFQPRNHSFPKTEFGTRLKPCKRHFKQAWYEKYNWLEYSIEKDAAFCFVCYLFKDKTSIPGSDKFVTDGFKGWNRAHERFRKHMGCGVLSAHKQAQEKYNYVHCFAHQLQLTLVAVAKENVDCTWFFEQVGFLLNLMGVSCKRKEMLRDVQAKRILESLELNEKKSGQGLNQELGLPRPGDTRWGSYYRTILSMMSLYPSIFEVLLIIGKTGHRDDRLKAQTMMASFESFQFVFMAQLMIVIFGYTNELCQALQRRDQDIVNAMTFVRLTKDRLLKTRDDGWEHFLEGVTSFCAENNIEVPQMDDSYVPPGRSRRYFEKITNIHRFRYDIFVSIIDKQLQELNDRFDKVNMELLICMSSFNLINSFAAFDKKKLIRLAEFYPDDFSSTDKTRLGFQLDHFIDDMRTDARFANLKDIGQLSVTLVSTNKHSHYQLVYLLLRLVLILPVATASVERVFSAMTYVKNKLRSSMGDELLNDSLVTFIERDFFSRVNNDDIIDRFQGKKTRNSLLPPRPLG